LIEREGGRGESKVVSILFLNSCVIPFSHKELIYRNLLLKPLKAIKIRKHNNVKEETRLYI
jgi:hypothetical protein